MSGSPATSPSQPAARTRRVLVVEDSALIRGILRTLLASQGHCHIVAEETTAAGALSSFRRFEPDVVLLDLQLAEGNGLEVLESISRAHTGAYVFVITNYVEEVFRQRCLDGGAYRFYDKSRQLGAMLADIAALAGV